MQSKCIKWCVEFERSNRLLEHSTERVRRWRPRPLGLPQAKLAERGANVSNKRPAQWMVGMVGRQGVGVAKRRVGGLSGIDRRRDVIVRGGDLEASH